MIYGKVETFEAKMVMELLVEMVGTDLSVVKGPREEESAIETFELI